jgi:PIN domain nuclease of toxin-antitoxin system
MSDAVFILDASALLALLFDEPGAERVATALPMAKMSAVNLSEVIAKLNERGVPDPDIDICLAELGLDVVPFDEDLAHRAGQLRVATRMAGLSLGDRACLALAASLDAVALTTDRAWSDLAISVRVALVR